VKSKRSFELDELHLPDGMQDLMMLLRKSVIDHDLVDVLRQALLGRKRVTFRIPCTETKDGPLPLGNFAAIAALQVMKAEGDLTYVKIVPIWIEDVASVASVLAKTQYDSLLVLLALDYCQFLKGFHAKDFSKLLCTPSPTIYKCLRLKKQLKKDDATRRELLGALVGHRGITTVANELSRRTKKKAKDDSPPVKDQQTHFRDRDSQGRVADSGSRDNSPTKSKDRNSRREKGSKKWTQLDLSFKR